MCGIAGVATTTGEPVGERLLRRMTDAIAHRGPDGEGHYIEGSVGLGNRRLAIIDLSEQGSQPLASETGDIVVMYNGEIYNFRALRAELERAGHRFASATDTEVLVHAWEQWGASCLDRLRGMFAFALLDRPARLLFLARDRFGIKPLYWWFRDGTLVFASEVKAILEHPAVSAQLCYPALDEYFTFQNSFSDLTLFEGVRMLPAGCTLTLDLADGAVPKAERYWDYSFGENGGADANDVRALFEQAVSRLPANVRGRPKTGFSAPDAGWFRGDSIDYVNRLLRNRNAALYEFLSPAYVDRILDEHCSGRVNHRLLIWSLLSFQWWCTCFLEGDAPRTPMSSVAARGVVA